MDNIQPVPTKNQRRIAVNREPAVYVCSQELRRDKLGFAGIGPRSYR